MVILDTHVVSELMRENPNSNVVAWLDEHPTSSLFITSLTEAEIRAGIALLPSGRRRRGLAAAAEHTFGSLFAQRILPFDSGAARTYAAIMAARRAAGRPISQFDCQIAAIARAAGAAVATGDENDFQGCGIPVINPWSNA